MPQCQKYAENWTLAANTSLIQKFLERHSQWK